MNENEMNCVITQYGVTKIFGGDRLGIFLAVFYHISHIPYYCVITQYSLTKINGGDISVCSSIAFNIVLKPRCRSLGTYTLLYCMLLYFTNLIYCTLCSPGLK